MLNHSIPKRQIRFSVGFKLKSAAGKAPRRAAPFAVVCVLVCFFSLTIRAQQQQQTDSKDLPVIVQPGAPGQPTRILPPSTRAKLPPASPKDAEFMQKMIMHHAQAVEMTALIESRTENKDIRLLGARISQSQSDEMKFMKRWLELRGEPISPPPPPPLSGKSKTEMAGMNHSSHRQHHTLMPGMLAPHQMNALKKAQGAAFDQLFLRGMIQHHEGALAMVKELFETPGAGQNAELFNFAMDVESGQRAEIKIMQTLLGEKP
jgi:uncharacterized protein (DUF305 family)